MRIGCFIWDDVVNPIKMASVYHALPYMTVPTVDAPIVEVRRTIVPVMSLRCEIRMGKWRRRVYKHPFPPTTCTNMYFMRVSPQHLHEVVYVDRSNKHILFYHPIPSYFATKLSVTMHPLKGTIWNAANIEDPSLWKVSKHVFHSNQFIWEGGGQNRLG